MADVMKTSQKTYYRALEQLLESEVLFKSTIYDKYWINLGKKNEHYNDGIISNGET